MDERYGVASPTRRRATQLAVAALGLLLLGWVAWAAWEHGRSDVSGVLTAYDVKSAHAVRVVVDISRGDDAAVVCDVTAQADDHSSVGEGRVKAVAGGANQVTATVTIRTDREATSVTVSNCRTGR